MGNFTIPQLGGEIVLNGRESKIIVTDFGIGEASIAYSTAEVFTVSIQNNAPVVFLWLPSDESGEFLLKGVREGSTVKQDGCADVKFDQVKEGIIVAYIQKKGPCVFMFDDHSRIVVLDRSTAYFTSVPSLSNDPIVPLNSTSESRVLRH